MTTDELPDPQTVPLSLAVNGVVRHKSNTGDMIFSVAEIVSHISQFMTILSGDGIVTGTPEGVGVGMRPRLFLKRGDVIDVSGFVFCAEHQFEQRFKDSQSPSGKSTIVGIAYDSRGGPNHLRGSPMWTNENRARYDRSRLRYPSW